MNNPMILAHLRNIYNDLDKILNATEEGKVPFTIDENGNVTEYRPYTMSNNAYLDIVGVQEDIRRVIAQFEGVF
jgi:hypothetical protein